jgi:hypothetical protein
VPQFNGWRRLQLTRINLDRATSEDFFLGSDMGGDERPGYADAPAADDLQTPYQRIVFVCEP